MTPQNVFPKSLLNRFLSLLRDLQHLRNLFLVLSEIAETVRPFRTRFDLVFEPDLVTVLIFLPGLPLAGVIVEFGFVHHGDAVLHRADSLTDAATAASLHIGVVQVFRSHVETRVRTMQPTESALDASIEVNHGPHGASAELLECGIAVRTITAFDVSRGISDSMAGRNRRYGDALTHLVPLGQLESVRRFRIALIGIYRDGTGALVGAGRGFGFHLIFPFVHDGSLHGVQAEQFRKNARDRAEDAHVCVIVFIDPQTGEAGSSLNDGEVVGMLLAVRHFNDFFRNLARGHDESPTGFQQTIDRLESIPGPRLYALAQSVIDGDGDVDFLWLILGHSFFQSHIVSGHDGEVFGGNAVALRAVSIAAKGNARFALFVRRQNDCTADVLGESLLINAA